jgi:hypothetical protein
MSVIGVVFGSALSVLEHPRWLLLSLAGFLVRGGVLVLLVAIVQIPTTAAVANLLGPTLVGFVFGGVSPGFLVLVGSAVGVLVAWLILGGLAGAVIDLEMIRSAASAEDLEGIAEPASSGPGAAALARLLAHVPTAVVIAIGASPLVDAAYQELIHPGDPTLSVPVRVILREPLVVGGLVAAWLFGETVGGLAARHLAWGASLPGALLRGLWSLVQPVGLLVLVVTTAVVLGAATLGWSALALAYELMRLVVREGQPTPVLLVGFVLLSMAWFGAAWLLALATAWRSTAWTFVEARRRRPRTIAHPTP